MIRRSGVRLKRTQALARRKQRQARIKNTSDGSVTRAAIRALLDGAVCEYCDVALTRENWSIDHRIPLSTGGTHTLDNLAPCCQSCNRKKWTLTDEHFMGEGEGDYDGDGDPDPPGFSDLVIVMSKAAFRAWAAARGLPLGKPGRMLRTPVVHEHKRSTPKKSDLKR